MKRWKVICKTRWIKNDRKGKNDSGDGPTMTSNFIIVCEQKSKMRTSIKLIALLKVKWKRDKDSYWDGEHSAESNGVREKMQKKWKYNWCKLLNSIMFSKKLKCTNLKGKALTNNIPRRRKDIQTGSSRSCYTKNKSKEGFTRISYFVLT